MYYPERMKARVSPVIETNWTTPVRRFAGHLPRRFSGGIICWILAIGRTSCALCVAGQNRRLFHYERTARFQLGHAVLEVAGTEWPTSASSWEQGRSTSAVVVNSEGLKDGSHQCFEIGASICFSDVYDGSWYGDSPVAGTSLRRQSVVLNVGIWYADWWWSIHLCTPIRRCTNS